MNNVIPAGLYLNLGCGRNNPPGWVNLDGSWQAWFAGHPVMAWIAKQFIRYEVGTWPRGILYRDLRNGLGYSLNSTAVIYSSHTLEHLHRDEALDLLRDCYGVLKPGGICRFVVPDLAAIIGWYLEHSNQPTETKIQSSSDMLMELLTIRAKYASSSLGLLSWYRQWKDIEYHKWMYDKEGLLTLFHEAGFKEPKSREYLDSLIPIQKLTLVEHADRIQNGAGIVVEAVR